MKLITTKALTTESINEIATSIINSVMDGDKPPLLVHAELAAIKSAIKEIESNKNYKDCVIGAIEAYGNDTPISKGASFQIRQSGVKYDYSLCNHGDYFELCKEIEALTEQRKELEKYLQSLPKGGATIVNESTGEVSKVYPPQRSSTDSIVVTFKKK